LVDIEWRGQPAFMASLHDITTHKLTAEQLSERIKARTQELETANQDLIMLKDKALEASRTKSQLLANVSHEVRNPLGAVLGLSEILKEMPLSEQSQELAQEIFSAMNSLMDSAALRAMCTTQRLCSMKVVGQFGTSRVKGIRSRSSGLRGLSFRARTQVCATLCRNSGS